MSYAEDISELNFRVNVKPGQFYKGEFVFLHVGFFLVVVVSFGNRPLSSVGQTLERRLDSTLSRNSLSGEVSRVCFCFLHTSPS